MRGGGGGIVRVRVAEKLWEVSVSDLSHMARSSTKAVYAFLVSGSTQKYLMLILLSKMLFRCR